MILRRCRNNEACFLLILSLLSLFYLSFSVYIFSSSKQCGCESHFLFHSYSSSLQKNLFLCPRLKFSRFFGEMCKGWTSQLIMYLILVFLVLVLLLCGCADIVYLTLASAIGKCSNTQCAEEANDPHATGYAASTQKKWNALQNRNDKNNNILPPTILSPSVQSCRILNIIYFCHWWCSCCCGLS